MVWNENRRDVTRGQAMEAGGPELVAWDGWERWKRPALLLCIVTFPPLNAEEQGFSSQRSCMLNFLFFFYLNAIFFF